MAYKQLRIWPEEPCRKLVVLEGKVVEIECENHTYSWSGQMPCTGVYRCVFCGHISREMQKGDE